MKIVFFNHHSDEMYWHIKTFESLGHECHVATRKLTLESGEDYCSFNEHGKVQKGPVFYDWKELHPDMDLKFTDSLDGFDAAVTTTSADAEGEIIAQKPVNVTLQQVESVLHSLS